MKPPAQASAVFGDRLGLAERFAEWLIGPGRTRGLLGPREADQIWERHLLNGVHITCLIEPTSVVLDIGSGAGLPGLALLLARPDLQLVLIEPKARRVDFLREVCADLGLPARIVRARATPAGLVRLPDDARGQAVPLGDVVTARAVAPIAELGRWAKPLLRRDGRLLAIKGAVAETELHRDRAVLTRLGFQDAAVLSVGTPVHGGPSVPGATATVISMRLGGVSRET
ncbi:MAG: 16S rRNA (guanine(527)-N(7))-methyltransferase RsmG [Geodermatophilaceae bacterium]